MWVQGASAAEWRSAVSRAYYAAFHVARNLLSSCNFRVPGDDRVHAYLWLRLANSAEANVQFAGNGLASLRGDRNWADYDFRRPITQRQAGLQVQNARKIILCFIAAAVDPIKTRITDGIRTYERDVLKEVTWQP